ncbi:MAG: hypothetical protein ABJB66_00025 [Gemmatimonadaceae bacterium]
MMEIVGPAADRDKVVYAVCLEESPGLIDREGRLTTLERLADFPWKNRYHDDGTTLWVYWDVLRRGPNLWWCERLSRAFPAITVRVQYLYENDLGSGRLGWKAGEVIEDVDLITDPSAFERVTDEFYDLMQKTYTPQDAGTNDPLERV